MLDFISKKKFVISLWILVVYVLSYFLGITDNIWLYLTQKAYAQSGSYQKIVSVFVEKNIYNQKKTNIERFAKTYLGKKISNLDVIIFTYDKGSFFPSDLAKINQNLYLEWKKWSSSNMIGTILIGDISLPVVNKNWFIFQTIYPLVDFVQPKFAFNPKLDMFEYQWEGNSQPEIWHSIINFGQEYDKYDNYFDKIRRYADDPTSFIWSGIRYDDIIYQKKTFDQDNVQNYINNYIFTEDISYNRYTNLMVDIFNFLHNSGANQLFSDYNSSQQDILNQISEDQYYDSPDIEELKSNYKKNIEKFRAVIKKLKSLLGSSQGDSGWNVSPSALGNLPDSRFINTLFLQTAVEGFLKYYIELYWSSYYDRREKNIQLWWRDSADDHTTMLTRVDEFTKQKIVDYNDKLEQALDQKIQEEWYDMNVIIPTLIEKGMCRIVADDAKPKKTFEVFYFGRPAEEVVNAQDFGIYRGTYLNIRSLAWLNTYDINKSLDYSQNQSLGGTRWENNREVEANRGYNFSLAEYDQQEFERVKNLAPYTQYKKKFRNDISSFIRFYRNGFTPLNIDTNNTWDIRLDIDKMDFKNLWNPFLNRTIGWPVFDIAWSRLTTPDRVVGMTIGTENEDDDGLNNDSEDWFSKSNTTTIAWYSDSYMGWIQFASAIQVKKNNKWVQVDKNSVFKWKPRKLPRITEMDFIWYDIFQKDNWEKHGIFFRPSWTESYIQLRWYCDERKDRGDSYDYIKYKSVSSIFEHKSPTFQEMFGQYTDLDNFKDNQTFYCSETPIEPPSWTCHGMRLNIWELAWVGETNHIADTILISDKRYHITGDRIYFYDGLDFSYEGIDISLTNLDGFITWENWDKILVYNYAHHGNEDDIWDKLFGYKFEDFECEAEDTPWPDPTICEGIWFQINDRNYNIKEDYYTIDYTGKNITFYPWAKVNIMNKDYDLWGLVGNIVGNKIIWSWAFLQVWWVNEMTIDRPVDSPKYVNFQGIWWDKVTMVYPDLYKVDVFKQQWWKRILKSIPEIKETIKSYLREKVSDYNISLKEQYDKRISVYENSSNKFEDWWDVDPKTYLPIKIFNNIYNILTPIDHRVSPLVQSDTWVYTQFANHRLRRYAYMDQDFLIDRLATDTVSTDDAISIIAHDLYYQNIMRSEVSDIVYKSTWDVIWDIVWFNDVNNKIRYIYDNYTTIYQSGIVNSPSNYKYVYPNYNSWWYAVWYINSDGDDFVDYNTLPPVLKYIDNQKTLSPKTKSTPINDNEKCGSVIPPSYQVALSRRPTAFKCWLETLDDWTLKFRFSWKLIDYISSGGADVLQDDIKQIGDGISSWWDEYGKHRSQILKKEDVWLTSTQKAALMKKLNNISYVFDKNKMPMDGTITLRLSSKLDIWETNIRINSSWNNCLIYGNHMDLCAQSLQIKGDFKNTLYTYSFKLRNNLTFWDSIWVVNVQFSICEDKCVYKNIQILINPADINRFKFETPFGDGVNVAKWSKIPISLRGYDIYNNQVWTTIYDFDITTQGKWIFLYEGSVVDHINTNTFPSVFLYDTAKSDVWAETLAIEPSDYFKTIFSTLPKQSYAVKIVDPIINSDIADISFKLPDDKDYYYLKTDYKVSLDINKLPKVKIHINELESKTYANISFKSAWWLVEPFIMSRGELIRLDDLIYTWVEQTVYLVPTYIAGKDNLQIQIWDTIKNIPINIEPANPRKTAIILDRSNIKIWDIVRASVLVTDIWWNKVHIPTKLNLWIYGNLSSQGISWANNKVDVQDGQIDFDIEGKANGGIWYVFATIEWVSLQEQYPDYKKILVQNRAWTESGLNINYLSLFGSSRGSKQEDKNTQPHISSSIANQIIYKSPKTISVTTQLLDASDIYNTLILITPSGQIKNLEGKSISLSLKDGWFYASTQGIGNIYLGPSSSATIKIASNINAVWSDRSIYYIPEKNDSFIYSNISIGSKVIINDQTMIDLSKNFISTDIEIIYLDNKMGWDSVWEIYYKDVYVWSMIIRSPVDIGAIKTLSSIDNSNYNFFDIDVWNGQSRIALQDLDMNMYDYDKQAPSIQDSSNPDYDIGRGDYFKNISQFSNGKSVGDSSISYSSEYMINFWDPTFSLSDKSQIIPYTDFDGSLWYGVYSDPEDTISQTIDIDFDKDGNRDLLIIYNSWKIRLVANRDKHFVDIWDLMYIEDGIKKVYVGDGDGDWYQDIFIHTNTNKLRFYKNYNGSSVDVDWYPVCLDVPDGDIWLDGVRERTLTDVNNDKIVDIITNDKNNNIKTFLGWGNNTISPSFAWANYISNDRYGCDIDWKARQKNNIHLVKSFALELDGQDQVDGSMVHYSDINIPPIEQSVEDVDLDSDDIEYIDQQLEPTEGNSDIWFQLPNTDGKNVDGDAMSRAVSDGVMSTIKPDQLLDNYANTLENINYLDSLFKPIFYNGDINNIPYKSIDHIISTDKISIVKRYSDVDGWVLKDGDMVKITIQINSRGYAWSIAYLEQLVWPFDIDKNFIYNSGWDNGTLPPGSTLKLQNVDPYLFMVDSIDIRSNQTILFSYFVRYKNKQIVNLKLWGLHNQLNGNGGSIWFLPKAYAQDKNDDSLFYLVPIDGCVKIRWKYGLLKTVWNSVWWLFGEQVEDFITILNQNAINDKQASDQWLQDVLSSLHDQVTSTRFYEKWKQEWFMWFVQKAGYQLEQIWNLNINTKIKLGISPDIDKQIDTKISDLTKWLCQGFKLGEKNCSGVPILSNLPFNMSFLTPWPMVVMWQKIFNDKWLPTITFPGNRWPFPPVWYIPAPGIFGFPFKGPGDSFGYFWVAPPTWGPYSSLMRLYLSPTLTAKLGIGICFAFNRLGNAIPKLFRDILGNCIVMSVDPGIGMCQQTSSGPTSDISTYVINSDNRKLQDFNSCNDNLSDDTKSPFKLVTKNIDAIDNRLEQAYWSRPSLRIKIGGNPNITNYDSVSISDFVKRVRLPDVKPLEMSIKWPKDSGLVSCILNQFVDNQIRYIINNMSSMDINIILPDLWYIWNNIVWLKRNNQAQIEYQNYYEKQTENKPDIIKSLTARESGTRFANYISLWTSNPIEKLQAFVNQSDLIKIHTKDVVINIPWIYMEDINKIKWIFDAWLRRNKLVIERRWQLTKDITAQCRKIDNQLERDKCMIQADQIAQFNTQLGQFERSVRQNLQVLEEYSQFPTKLYDFIHTYDQYLDSANDLMYSVVDQLFGRLGKIARWFDAWVDFIVSMVNILKSRQIIIDFSINWKQKCSKCTVDNYSAYSCTLKWFCPKLPVFSIPPFKIPDITIDLSNIDFRTDIILPRFRFVPKKLDIIPNIINAWLPDLPYPSDIWSLNNKINIKLPNIPVIPSPPNLDLISLPSFIPTFEFDGPVLPPAPRLPKIAPELGMAIDIADFIGRVFCIVKNGIWLVWEKWVKSRIEQMTQRTWQVEPRDSLQLLIPKAPLRSYNLFGGTSNNWWSFDIKVDAFVDLKFSFDGIYALFQWIADQVNNFTDKWIGATDKAIKYIETTIGDESTEMGRILKEREDTFDKINDVFDTSIDITIEPFGMNLSWYEDKLVYDDTNSVPYEKYNIVNDKVKKDLAYFITKDDDKTRLQAAKQILKSYDYKSNASVNYDGINNIANEVNKIIKSEKDKNYQLQEKIRLDRDGFLDQISQDYLADDSLDITFSTNLLNADKQTMNYLTTAPNPYHTLFKTNKIVIDGVVDAIDHENYTTLGISRSQYNQQKDYLYKLKWLSDKVNNAISSEENTNTSTSLEDGTSSSNQYISISDNITQTNTLLAQEVPDNPIKVVAGADVVDPGLYLDGIFVKWIDGNYHNVVKNRDKAKKFIDRYFEKDMNRDNKSDIVMRDEHNVYIKYALDRYPKNDGYEANLVTINLDSSFKPDEYGYVSSYKVRSPYHTVKNWEVRWQDYTTITYSLANDLDQYSQRDIWYVVRYSDDIYANTNKSTNFAYIVLLSNIYQWENIRNIDMDGIKLSLDNKNVKVVYLDPVRDNRNAILSNLSRKRYYATAARLSYKMAVNRFIKIISFGSNDGSYMTLDKSSPWSYMNTAGMQIIADNSAPSLVLWLYRKTKNQSLNIDNFKWYINTYYTLSGYRWDDSKVIKNYVVMGDKIIYSGSDGKFEIPTLFSAKPAIYDLVFVWEDPAGNKWQREVRVELWFPDINIDKVDKNILWQTDIISSINTDMDTGVVRFISIRNDTPTLLKTSLWGITDFWLSTYQTTITWWKFGLKNEIGFYDSDGRSLGVKIVEDGQLIIQNNAISTNVSRYDNMPKLQIIKWGAVYYTIYLKPKSISKSDVKILDNEYTLADLKSNTNLYDIFEGGYCIQIGSDCMVYINERWNIYAPKPISSYLGGQYRYSNGKVYYTISRWSDVVAEIWFEIEPIKW